jgi:hypothetical protein
VIGSVYKGYPGPSNAAHQCLVGCKGLYAGFPYAKLQAQAALPETLASRVPRYAGLCPPPSWARFGHPAAWLCSEQNPLGLPPARKHCSHLRCTRSPSSLALPPLSPSSLALPPRSPALSESLSASTGICNRGGRHSSVLGSALVPLPDSSCSIVLSSTV